MRRGVSMLVNSGSNRLALWRTRAGIGGDESALSWILSRVSFFDLPVSAIFASNPNDGTQLIAFAISGDQGAALLIEVLTFLRNLMGGDTPMRKKLVEVRSRKEPENRP
jgi:hypothetical protein